MLASISVRSMKHVCAHAEAYYFFVRSVSLSLSLLLLYSLRRTRTS